MAHPFGAAAFVHPLGTLQAKGVGVEQSKLMVGGLVVQAQGCGPGGRHDGVRGGIGAAFASTRSVGDSGTGVVQVNEVVARDGFCAYRGTRKGSRKVLRGSPCSPGNGAWCTG